jgi:hypothetical protein
VSSIKVAIFGCMYPRELNTAKPEKTHFMSLFRKNYLERVLAKLQELMDSHVEMFNNEGWYDGIFLNEDCEETLGFVFVACQTFIVGTIADSSENRTNGDLSFKDKERAMKNAPQFKNARTKIELINAVANYYKHKDEGKPLGETKKILEAYNLLSEDFPINEAFSILTENHKIETIADYLCGWSNHLFNTALAAKNSND